MTGGGTYVYGVAWHCRAGRRWRNRVVAENDVFPILSATGAWLKVSEEFQAYVWRINRNISVGIVLRGKISIIN